MPNKLLKGWFAEGLHVEIIGKNGNCQTFPLKFQRFLYWPYIYTYIYIYVTKRQSERGLHTLGNSLK
jgi:hypothetical protein